MYLDHLMHLPKFKELEDREDERTIAVRNCVLGYNAVPKKVSFKKFHFTLCEDQHFSEPLIHILNTEGIPSWWSSSEKKNKKTKYISSEWDPIKREKLREKTERERYCGVNIKG